MQKLNERQKEAVTLTEGRVRVVAGAGSGKTTVLAHRYAFIVNELGISPGNIVCLTFTNKAASEMRRRISRMTDRGNVNDFICTIHGFCAKFLRTEIYRLGFPKTFIILDEADANQLARQAMQEYGIDRRKTTTSRFLAEVGKCKGADADGYIRSCFLPESPQEAPDAIARYMKLQLKQYALDFDDLLYFTLYILRNFPAVRSKWTQRLNYVMIDEGQDCDRDDWQLVRLLSEHHSNLFVVGDPDQAIYEWRGASPQLFVDFNADTTVIMDTNYRSTPQILDAANSIIANNKNRIPKDLNTPNPGGLLPEHRHCKSQTDEAENIAATIGDEHKAGRRYGQMAVLYRSSFISSELEHALVRHKIPYTVWGGAKFMERREIKDVMSYLRLIDSGDDMAFERIANVPSRKFGQASMDKLKEMAAREGRSLYHTLASHPDVRPCSLPAMRRFVALIEECKVRREVTPVSEIADYVLTASGYTDMLRRDEEEERLENLAELINQMKAFEKTRGGDDAEVSSLTQYLQEMALYTAEEEGQDKNDAVRLMTIHQAKGLEFPVVIVAGLTEGTFPSHRTIRERRDRGEEEERRLMYVAVTRAMDRLYLSECEGYLNENGALKFPSRFLYEIPDDRILRVGAGEGTDTLFSGTRMVVDRLNSEVYGASLPLFAVGDEVTHKIFGDGRITAYDPEADAYTVAFATCTRTLMPRVLSRK